MTDQDMTTVLYCGLTENRFITFLSAAIVFSLPVWGLTYNETDSEYRLFFPSNSAKNDKIGP